MCKFCTVPTSQYGPNCGNSWSHQQRMASLRKILQPCWAPLKENEAKPLIENWWSEPWLKEIVTEWSYSHWLKIDGWGLKQLCSLFYLCMHVITISSRNFAISLLFLLNRHIHFRRVKFRYNCVWLVGFSSIATHCSGLQPCNF